MKKKIQILGQRRYQGPRRVFTNYVSHPRPTVTKLRIWSPTSNGSKLLIWKAATSKQIFPRSWSNAPRSGHFILNLSLTQFHTPISGKDIITGETNYTKKYAEIVTLTLTFYEIFWLFSSFLCQLAFYNQRTLFVQIPTNLLVSKSFLKMIF